MGVVKNIIKQGDGKTFPVNGKSVTVHYTGYLNEVKRPRLPLEIYKRF